LRVVSENKFVIDETRQQLLDGMPNTFRELFQQSYPFYLREIEIMRKMYPYLTLVLLSLVCINGLTGDAHYIVLDVVKASNKPLKIKPHVFNRDGGREYAFASLALPYIKDAKIRKRITAATWCGTPTMTYVLKNGRPTENELRMEAALIDARDQK
jgi:hypothetical protein